ncbi:hypothetical protein [Nocardia cyriacigeorgica]|nr:hypothetical protein [Nocardia cyriacigeorgica]
MENVSGIVIVALQAAHQPVDRRDEAASFIAVPLTEGDQILDPHLVAGNR